MKRLGELMKTGCAHSCATTGFEQLQQMCCESLNKEAGALTGQNCPVCKNKGRVYRVSDGILFSAPCHCMQKRATLWRMVDSGLGNTFEALTFESFCVAQDWQRQIKDNAQRFLEAKGSWFYIGGQSGAGKTHICTAIVGKLIDAGSCARYMLWRDEIVRLKASVGDAREYAKLIEPLKETQVLYIDDFFKSGRGQPPSAGDINVAAELIGVRYNDPELITVISSEYELFDLLMIDEAICGRIRERATGFVNSVSPDRAKNWRLSGAK